MKKIILTIAISALFFSCNNKFLDRLPKTEIGEQVFFNTEEDLRMYSLSLYNFPTALQYTADGGTDNQATTSPTEIKSIMTMKNPDATTINNDWDWKQLYDINILLRNVSRAKVSDAVRMHYEGIARFFRARFYMDKVKRYSDVPWFDKSITPSDTALLYKKRDPRTMIVQKIFEDYKFAAEHVFADQLSGAVNKWVVLTYMSRDALYEGTFRKYHKELNLQLTDDTYLQIARDAARKVMDSGRYKIYNTNHPNEDYAQLFVSNDLSSNPEVILPRYYDYKLLPAKFWAFAFGNYESCPTKDLLQAYLMKDGSFYSDQPSYKTNSFVQEFKDRDPRLKQTYAYPGWQLINTSTYAPGDTVYVQQLNKNFSGYHLIKGFVNKTSIEDNNNVDFPILRYAEVLLNYAEARAELNELTSKDVDESINRLRKRAGMPLFDMNNVKTDPLQERKFPNSTPLIREIRRERRVELAFEGFRFDDLMRWDSGKVLEEIPHGLYFPSLGVYDLTGDGIPDIKLIPSSESIPAEKDKEENSLGRPLVYYRTGDINDPNATVYLSNGTSGDIITIKSKGQFIDPKYYYRPIPAEQVQLNKNLLPQLFNWN